LDAHLKWTETDVLGILMNRDYKEELELGGMTNIIHHTDNVLKNQHHIEIQNGGLTDEISITNCNVIIEFMFFR